MPETACLHIQARENDPIRVVELPGTSVRIGRAPFCEVHLPEPALADEECELRRRGGTWHLVPVGDSGALSIDGRLVDRPRPLPYGVALRVGAFSLTLRPAGATAPEWTAAAAGAAAAPPTPRARVELTPTLDARPRREPGVQRPRAGADDREKRWEARWKAAAERLRTGSEATVAPTPTPKPAPATTIPEVPRAAERLNGWRQVDLPRRDDTRPLSRPVAPAAFPSLKTVEPPSARRTKPAADVHAVPPEPAAVHVASQEDEAIVFIAPSELDWAAAEARQVAFDAPAAPAAEPLADIIVPVVEDATSPDDTADSDLHEEAPPPRSGLVGRLGQGILALWDRKAARRAAAEESPVAVETIASAVEPAEIVIDETHATGGSFAPTEDFERATPTLEAAGAIWMPAPKPAIDETPARDDSTVPVEAGAVRTADPTNAPPQALNTDEDETPTPSLAAEMPQGDDSTDEPVPPRRSLFARRRAKVRTRTPRLGSVRVVPNEAARGAPVQPVATPEPPAQVHDPLTVDRVPEHAAPESPTPERPQRFDPPPFTARTWQADTGPWTELGASAVSTSTWHAGVGRENHSARPASDSARPGAANPSWPSARDILAARARSQVASPPPPAAAARRPQPTVAREPEHFAVPLWLGWPPLATAAVAMAVLGVALAWTWAQDARTAGVIAKSLGRSKPGGNFPIAPEELAAPAWWRSSGGALARRAAALARSDEGVDPEDVRTLLMVATQASPLEPSARLALARLPVREDDPPVRLKSIGLSRDTLALAWTGRQLVLAGQKESAVRAYRSALELAASADIARLTEPAYNDDPQVRRYALPGEELIGQVVREIAGHTEWTFEEWAPALPAYAVAPLVAARRLRDHDRGGSDMLVERLTGDDDSRVPPPGTPAAIHIAARAEAFALKGNWAQAQALYQQAIDLMPVDRIKRSWQLNLADLALRQNDEPARQKALEAANNHDPNDPITLRAVDLQKAPGERTARGAGALRDDAITRSSAKSAR